MMETIGNNLNANSNTLVGLSVGFTVGYLARSNVLRMVLHRIRSLPGIMSGQHMKMVIVVRGDVPMSKGKIGSQCAHAAVACFDKSNETVPKQVGSWLAQGQPKIVLRAGAEGDVGLMKLYDQAVKKGLVAKPIRDAGKTEVRSGTLTCVGIGPGPAILIDEVTGHLKPM